ncbi:related to mitochondrial GTPase [Ramularia collo-cygni]|uniref:Related to mitochondrial GTPase n=1 Tax=Ramularia collo-cygni TaxID=112498 RepID=A0A2D3UWW9_9PEZI|nr:related to mitochondrial GTPase [Ramularia collo-cygni]CZT19898.1 related to mitochondrial GTPase [Ramularia collo-cygni]
MNNRLDLTQVEALGDTLSADTEQQRKLSIRGTTGGLAKRYEDWRQQLLYARGELEALIDFSEDQHFDESPAELCASVSKQIVALKRILLIHTQNAVRGELLRHGISVSLLGPPNAGKSSLLNRIVGREAAIVSHEAGTTRDVVEIGLDLGGYFCRFGDTAGLRLAKEAVQGGQSILEAINHIEQEGMRRAKARAADSDLVIVVLGFETVNDHTALNFDAEVCAVANQLHQEKGNVLLVINKSDLLPMDEFRRDSALRIALDHFPGLARDRVYMVSCIDGPPADASTPFQSSDPGGIQKFLQGLIQQFGRLTEAVTSESSADEPDPSVWQEALGATERHRVLLEACVGHLDAFLAEATPSTAADGQRYRFDPAGGLDSADATRDTAADEEADIVVAAEHLRFAADCLAKITGRGDAGDVNEVLGVVFEKFCVGK